MVCDKVTLVTLKKLFLVAAISYKNKEIWISMLSHSYECKSKYVVTLFREMILYVNVKYVNYNGTCLIYY
ncbi:hypothetical protein prwr041_07810 [Prevotella herbatica]|uniref:Uncharacterized protein n=1 Tax=Prevotella herbatica TaxID=2801997 RepID=A0ABM7NWY5_9BACT|nr:hypothetical protein prwr041_07810 [Prevotella herbatica]